MVYLLKSEAQPSNSESKSQPPVGDERERVLYGQPTGPNPLHHRDDFSGLALRHGSFNSLFQVETTYYDPRISATTLASPRL